MNKTGGIYTKDGGPMRVLFVYPQYPETYWSFHYALKFISRKANYPPLGLATIAAMLPSEWEMKLVDMNVQVLKDSDIKWADYVFISAMVVQKESVKKVVERCKRMKVPTVAGGPLFTAFYEEFADVDHLVLNEGEITLPLFLEDMQNGSLKHIYSTAEWADITKTPVPLWNLIDANKYATMNLQYSRGCPFNCEFCNITALFGRVPRTKSADQIVRELQGFYDIGWRSGVLFVDDNFIGNRNKLKKEILPAIKDWMNSHDNPFTFYTEASVDLADDDELMSMMTQAGFNTVFVGIETPEDDSLKECNKYQNRDRDLMSSVKKIHAAGMQVQGGFILGFDNDKPGTFDRLIKFIQESGIVTAMVGLLNAPKGTKLYKRMADEGRIMKDFTGDNTDYSMNFKPKMNYDLLVKGYKKVIDTIYSPKYYCERVIKFLKEYKPLEKESKRIKLIDISAFFKSLFVLGVAANGRLYYWKLFFWSLFKRPKMFPMAITFSIYGFHFRKVFKRTD